MIGINFYINVERAELVRNFYLTVAALYNEEILKFQ
jgi:hypothetical protein